MYTSFPAEPLFSYNCKAVVAKIGIYVNYVVASSNVGRCF